jgi:integrase
MARKRIHDPDLPVGIRRGHTPGTLEVRVTLPPVPGQTRYRQITKTVRGGVREAQRVRADLLLSREQQGGADGSVAQLLNRWLDLIEPELSPNTMVNYRAYTTRYILPYLGARPMRRLTTYDIDAFYRELTAKGLAPATVRQAHSILRKALSEAVRWKQLPVNPAVDARPPKLVERQLTPPSMETYRLILHRATYGAPGDRDRKIPKRVADPTLGAFLWVAGATGARRAELCGLRWSDIDSVSRTVTISRSVVAVGGKLTTKAPKTARSVRSIAVGPADLAVLDTQLARCTALAAVHHLEVSPDGYVFTDDPEGLEPWQPNRVSQAFRRITADLGVTVRLHDLRHFHTTVLLAQGVDVRTVAGRLGHANPTMTLNRYGHFMPAADRRAADTYAELMSPTSE